MQMYSIFAATKMKGASVMHEADLKEKSAWLRCVRNEVFQEQNIVTPGEGIEGLLQYRIDGGKGRIKQHPDSFAKTPEGLRLYGAETGRRYSDAIFNGWSFLSRFIRGIEGRPYVEPARALGLLDHYFDGRAGLRAKLDILADRHHCLANFMPSKVCINGWKGHDGKGNWRRDNDFPDIYYRRAKKDFPLVWSWLNENMHQCHLEAFSTFRSGLKDGSAHCPVDTSSREELLLFEASIENALECLEERAAALSSRPVAA